MQWTRRQWMSGAAGAALGAVRPTAAQPAARPNVVLILADDLGIADLSVYGQQRLKTPNLDRLAADGLRFQQAYAGSTVCAPSRCCLMTGKHTGHATVRGNQDPHVPLRADEPTVAELFQKAGYATGAFGKWGLGTPPNTHALPTRKGFDEFYGYLHQVHAHTYFPDMLWDNEREHYLPMNFGGARKAYSHDRIAERALAFIDQNRTRPFFLYAPFTLPHGRFEVPDVGAYAQRDWPPAAQSLASMITRLDDSVGAILARLKQHNLEENTLVLFTSDNGPVKLGVDNFASAAPYRGFKRDLYEGGIRVPFLARWPGRIRPGVTEQPIAFWDVLPTAADLLDVTTPPGDGISFLPTLRGEPARQQPHEYLYWEFHERGFQQAIRMGDWKGVRLAKGTPLELYNLAQDPGEKTNLAEANPSAVRQLEARLQTCRTPTTIWG